MVNTNSNNVLFVVGLNNITTFPTLILSYQGV